MLYNRAVMKLKIKNSKISGGLLFAILVVYELVVISAIDVYVPALPVIRDEFAVSESYLNLTVFAFLFASAVVILAAGPISDKIGRKPSLIIAGISFSLGSVVCAMATDVPVLVVGRILESIGMAFVCTLATAIVEEAFAKESVKSAMALLQSLILIGPFLAPFAGTLMLTIADWRAIFWLLLVLGLVCTLLCFLLPETRPNNIAKVKAAESLKVLLRDKKFLIVVVLLGLSGLPCFAFIAVCSYICLDFFQESYMTYNILYALVCAVSFSGPFIFQALSKRLSNFKVFLVAMACFAASSVLMPFFGFANCLICVACYLPYVLAEGIIRPLSFVILLDQPAKHVGTASSIANFSYSILTSFGSVFATLSFWPNAVFATIGVLIASFIASAIFLVFYWRA